MKKIIAMLVVATMLITGVMAITASAADATVNYTVDVQKNNDDTIDVVVSIDIPDGYGFLVAEAQFLYNAEALEIDADSIDVDLWAIGRKDSFDVAYEDVPGELYFSVEADDLDNGIAVDGQMFSMTFKVLDAAAEYNFALAPYNADPANHSLAQAGNYVDGLINMTVNVKEAETTAPADDETTAPADDETTAPVVDDETTAPADDETTAPVVDETTAPADDETTAPVVDETTAPVVDDETTAPEADDETTAPVQTEKPAETTKPAAKPQSPQTGDSMVFVAVIAVLALAACSTVVVVRSKKSSK